MSGSKTELTKFNSDSRLRKFSDERNGLAIFCRASLGRNRGRFSDRQGGNDKCSASRRRRENGLRPRRRGSRRGDDFILRGIDVLIFVHENKAKFFAPAFGDRQSVFLCQNSKAVSTRIVPGHENPERRRRVCVRKNLRKNSCASRNNVFHVAANPIPIFSQRIVAIFNRRERIQKCGILKKISPAVFQNALFAFSASCLKRNEFRLKLSRHVRAKILLAALQKFPDNSAAFTFSARQIFENWQPFIAPICNAIEQPLSPFDWFGGGNFSICSASQPPASGRVCE